SAQVAQQLDDLLSYGDIVRAHAAEHLGGDALLVAGETDEKVLGADVVVVQLERGAQHQLEGLLGAGRERRRHGRGRRARAWADDLLDLGPSTLERQAE